MLPDQLNLSAPITIVAYYIIKDSMIGADSEFYFSQPKSIKPCPQWRLYSLNLATIVAKNRDCRRIRREIVSEFGDYGRQCGLTPVSP